VDSQLASEGAAPERIDERSYRIGGDADESDLLVADLAHAKAEADQDSEMDAMELSTLDWIRRAGGGRVKIGTLGQRVTSAGTMAPRVTFLQDTGRPRRRMTTDTAEIGRFFREHSHSGPTKVREIPFTHFASPGRHAGRAPRMATNARHRGSRRRTPSSSSSSDDPGGESDPKPAGRTCVECGTSIDHRRPNARFCCERHATNHRVRAHRRRQAERDLVRDSTQLDTSAVPVEASLGELAFLMTHVWCTDTWVWLGEEPRDSDLAGNDGGLRTRLRAREPAPRPRFYPDVTAAPKWIGAALAKGGNV